MRGRQRVDFSGESVISAANACAKVDALARRRSAARLNGQRLKSPLISAVIFSSSSNATGSITRLAVCGSVRETAAR
ncbi:MAG: hypothetical protein ACLUHE_05450 [Christensenellales bacterium]